MKHIIGFPGLFADRFVVDRAAFDLGKLLGSDEPRYVYWYGIIIVCAMIVFCLPKQVLLLVNLKMQMSLIVL